MEWMSYYEDTSQVRNKTIIGLKCTDNGQITITAPS